MPGFCAAAGVPRSPTRTYHELWLDKTPKADAIRTVTRDKSKCQSGLAAWGSMGSDQMPGLARVATAAELRAAGLSRGTVRGLVRRGEMLPLSRGVYAMAGAAAAGADPRRARFLPLAAALAISGPSAVASHHDAAIIHGIALLDYAPADVAVARPPGAAGSRSGRTGIRLHIAALPSGHVTVRDGIPVTTVARTVIDIARTTSFKSGVVTADSALYTRQTSIAKLSAVMWDCERWPGIGRARQVVDFGDARAESAFESIARVAFRDGGLPQPLLQVWICGNERTIGRVDFLWDEQRTIAEADGAAKYEDPDRARKQLWRDAELRRAGYEVVHFSWAELASAPDQVVRAIWAAFGRAARLREMAG